ncbi:MAG: hypothetical protein LC623_09935, partial [Halobacteriales archaeon]|nr:hypothetical protein [Halobacteriales archaeon]
MSSIAFLVSERSEGRWRDSRRIEALLPQPCPRYPAAYSSDHLADVHGIPLKTLDWRLLRSWQGSQQKAFEELVCQLAAQEPEKGEFIRKGAPDAGLEAYWQQPGGKQVGYQAKYFSGPLT